MRTETSLKRLLWDRLNQLQGKQCLIKDCSIRLLVLTLVLVRKMTTTSMINHYLLTGLQPLFTRVSKKCQLMMMNQKPMLKVMLRRFFNSQAEVLKALITLREQGQSQWSLKRGDLIKLMIISERVA